MAPWKKSEAERLLKHFDRVVDVIGSFVFTVTSYVTLSLAITYDLTYDVRKLQCLFRIAN